MCPIKQFITILLNVLIILLKTLHVLMVWKSCLLFLFFEVLHSTLT